MIIRDLFTQFVDFVVFFSLCFSSTSDSLKRRDREDRLYHVLDKILVELREVRLN